LRAAADDRRRFLPFTIRLGSVFDRLSNHVTAWKCRQAALLTHQPLRTPFKNGENGRNGERQTTLLPSLQVVGHSADEGDL
jgi:hypothetical protein